MPFAVPVILKEPSNEVIATSGSEVYARQQIGPT